jgi:hypothetical protein
MALPGLHQHRKFKLLVHVMGEPFAHVRGYLECMWDTGYESGDAFLGSAQSVEAAAGYPGQPGKLCAALLEAGFVDQVDSGYEIHDLLANAPQYVKRRRKREQERKNREAGASLTDQRSTTDQPLTDQRSTTDQPLVDQRLVMSSTTCNLQPATCNLQPSPSVAGSSSEKVNEVTGKKKSAPSCSAASEPPVPPVLTFPCSGKKNAPKEWHLTEAKLAEYREAFPGVDALAECRKALQWARDNPKKRKTAGGTPAFLTRWLSSAQDRGGGPGGPQRKETPLEILARLRREEAETKRQSAELIRHEKLAAEEAKREIVPVAEWAKTAKRACQDDGPPATPPAPASRPEDS